jgi:hypothetical protein
MHTGAAESGHAAAATVATQVPEGASEARP